MTVYGLLSSPPSVTPNSATNRQFLDQYLRDYSRLEQQWLSRLQPPLPAMPGPVYTPGAFPEPVAAPAPPTLAPPPSVYGGGDGAGGMPGGPMSEQARNAANNFGAMSMPGYGRAALGALGMTPMGPMASAIGMGLAMNNVAANQAMRDFYGAAPMSFGQQLGGLLGGGLLGALGIGNESGSGISRETAQRSYEAAIDRGMGFDVASAPIGSGLAGVFGGSGYGHAPGEGDIGFSSAGLNDSGAPIGSDGRGYEW